MSKNTLICSLLIILYLQNVLCAEENNVDFYCTDLQIIDNRQTKGVFKLLVRNSKTFVGRVEFIRSQYETFTTKVEMLSINTGDKSVWFVPAGIKKNFPELTAFQIIHSGLTHLESKDMEQFGNDLIHANFWDNSLTALEGDLFEFNENLEYIGLHHNLLKYIDPMLFQNIEKMKKIVLVEFLNSECIDQNSVSLNADEWNYNKCNDKISRDNNLKKIEERKFFFFRGNCVRYQCKCNDNSLCNPHTGICICSKTCLETGECKSS